MQVDFAQPAKRKEQQLSLLVFNPLTVLVYRDEMTIEQDKSLLLWHRVRCYTEDDFVSVN